VVAGDPYDTLRLDLDHHRGCEIRSDENHVPVQLVEVPRVRKLHEIREDSSLQILEVVQAVEHHRVGGSAPACLQLEYPELERPSGRESILAHVALGTRHDLGVLEHEDLRVEDPGLDLTDPLGRPRPKFFETNARRRTRRDEPIEFEFDLRGIHDPM